MDEKRLRDQLLKLGSTPFECDQYSVMGEITEMNTTKNAVTGEQVYELGLVCNDVPIDICINEKDLFGVPEVGRRFKGQIWLQGMLEHL